MNGILNSTIMTAVIRDLLARKSEMERGKCSLESFILYMDSVEYYVKYMCKIDVLTDDAMMLISSFIKNFKG